MPVMEGLCKYESLIDGTMDLADVALLNDALMVKADNRELIRKQRREESNG